MMAERVALGTYKCDRPGEPKLPDQAADCWRSQRNDKTVGRQQRRTIELSNSGRSNHSRHDRWLHPAISRHDFLDIQGNISLHQRRNRDYFTPPAVIGGAATIYLHRRSPA
jgi:hypothetical protein